MGFSRLIRFEGDNGSVQYGDLGSSKDVRPEAGQEVDVLSGDIEKGFKKNGDRKSIKKVSFEGSKS